MATNFPTSLDALTNPTGTDTVAAVDHAAQHANANDAIEAIQAILGTNATQTTPTGSGRVLRSTSATATTWAQLVLTTDVTGVLPVANGGTNASSASITAFNNITGYTASGATGATSSNIVFSEAPTFTTSITTPSVLASSNDSGALGASGTAFSDLFLASGGVINWAAGDATITHSTGVLTHSARTITSYSNTSTSGTASVIRGISNIVMENPSASGQTYMSTSFNGVVKSFWRFDYVGNINYVSGVGVYHAFYTSAVSLEDTFSMQIWSTGVAIGEYHNPPGGQLGVYNVLSSRVALYVKGAASQSANLLTLDNSSAVTQFSVGPAGITTMVAYGAGLATFSSAGVLSSTTMGTGVLTFLTTPSSANLLAAVTDETGTGALVFGITPTITTPIFTNGAIGFSAPEGFLINGKIVPSVSSNNLTVAIKGIDGNDPSATNPVYCRIGGVVRSITSALSVTKNAATNWFNSGSTELATQEIDYFVYLGYNATDGVVVAFSRIANADQYSIFSVTSTNEKYAAISTITTAAATDYYNVVGRFAATLSAGAGYTWSVPTFTASNLIQRPIYETRSLTYAPTWTTAGGNFTNNPSTTYLKYKLVNNLVKLDTYGVFNATSGGSGRVLMSIPFTALNAYTAGSGIDATSAVIWGLFAATTNFYIYKYDGTTPIVNSHDFTFGCTYEI